MEGRIINKNKSKVFFFVITVVIIVVVIVVSSQIILKDYRRNIMLHARTDLRSVSGMLNSIGKKKNDNPDMWSCWPKLKDDNLKEIDNSTAYFLYIMTANKLSHSKLWNKIFNCKNVCKWTIAFDISSNTDKALPILFSADLDPEKLVNAMMFSVNKNIELDLLFEPGVVLKKSNDIFFTSCKYFQTERAVNHGNVNVDFTNWPSEIFYLTPTGIVNIVIKPLE